MGEKYLGLLRNKYFFAIVKLQYLDVKGATMLLTDFHQFQQRGINLIYAET